MELITILNRCHRFRGFVYQHAHFSADKKSIEVAVRPRRGSAAVCSRCHLPAPGYDQLAEPPRHLVAQRTKFRIVDQRVQGKIRPFMLVKVIESYPATVDCLPQVA